MPDNPQEKPAKTSRVERERVKAKRIIEVCRAGLIETVAEMNERHHKEECANLLKAFEIAEWSLRRTAFLLEIRQDMLQKMLERHPELEAEQKKKMEEPYGSKKA